MLKVVFHCGSSMSLFKVNHYNCCCCLAAAIHDCNKTMRAACAVILSLKAQQDAERCEHRRYNSKARDEVMRLRRQLDDTNQQLNSEMQKVGQCWVMFLLLTQIYKTQNHFNVSF